MGEAIRTGYFQGNGEGAFLMILYKYLAPERVDVLTKGHIRYTQLGALNDPFEGKPCLAAVNTDDEINEIIAQTVEEQSKESPVLSSVLNEYLPQRKMRMRDCINQNTPYFQQVGRENLAKNYVVLSLTENGAHQLMWSHYAQSHEGFAVGLDSTHKYFDQRKSVDDAFGYLRKVEYQCHRPRVILTEMTVKDMFLVKGDDWKYEQEWRIIQQLDHADSVLNPTDPYPIGLFSFPSDAITKIILGAQMPKSDRQKIIDIRKNSENLSHVKLFQAEASQNEFAIDIKEISP